MTSFRLLTKQEEKREQSLVAQGGHPSFSVEAGEWQVQGRPGSFDSIFMAAHTSSPEHSLSSVFLVLTLQVYHHGWLCI